MAKRKTRRSGKRTALSVLCVFLGVVLAVMLGGTVYFGQLYNKMNYVDPETQETISREEWEQMLSGETDPDASGPAIDPDAAIDTEHDTQIGGKGSGIVNILLIGQDRRPGENRARSDSMILCTFNKETGKLVMTSFLRDLWVEIPGYGNNRLNAAYSAGGMGLLDKTLQHNFGIRVDGNIEVDFTQFSRIIDLLGGVELELRQDEANLINGECGSSLRAGLQTLNGNEALSYARIRRLDADSDLSRSNRQRKVLTSLVAKFKDSDMNTMLKLLDQVLPMVTTDMKQAEIIGLATEVFPMLMKLEMVSQRIPADGAYRFATISGMSVVEADMDAARDLLEQTLMN